MTNKSKFLILPLVCFLLPNTANATANAIDMDNGVWKNLNEKYQQTTQNDKLISGFVSNRVYYNNTYDSNSRKKEFSDSFLKTKVGVNVKLGSNFAVKAVTKFEKASQASQTVRRNQLATGGGDQSFENEGAYIDELVLNYNYKNFSALAGKFAANYGYAWKDDNGIWVNEFAKAGYETDEKLGLGVIQRFGDRKVFGEYVFGFSAFTNDRKNLDNSTITKRDSDAKSDGSVGDTRSLKSYIASMDLYYDFNKQEKLSYHFAYSNLAINDRQNTSNIPALIDDQKSFVINMDYKYPINNDLLINGFIEYNHIANVDGNVSRDANFITANLTTYFNDFSLTIARAREQQIEIGTNGVDAYINELSLGYKFDNLSPVLKGLSMAVGYKGSETDDKTAPIKNDAFGIMLKHKMEF